MKFEETPIKDLYVVHSVVHGDERGSFMRAYCAPSEKAEGFDGQPPVQINISCSAVKGTIRGLHYQKTPAAEGKTVRCIKGRIFDVAVDLRSTSPTFLQHFAIELTAGDGKALRIPKGFAHGFQTLENDCDILYLHDVAYDPEYQGGVLYNDEKIKIKWPMPPSFLSDRDKNFSPLPDDFKGIE